MLVSCYLLFLGFELFSLWLHEPVMAIACRLLVICALRIVCYLRHREAHLYDELTFVLVMIVVLDTGVALLFRGLFSLYNLFLIWPVTLLLLYTYHGEQIMAHLFGEKARPALVVGEDSVV